MRTWTAVMAAALLMIGGCVSAGKDAGFEQKAAAARATIESLKAARFKGEFRFEGAGSPFGAGLHAVNFFSIGPRESQLYIDGEVDFSEPHQSNE